MASKKKPSIYDDRSSIGSSKELDEYGVWVKSEPRDIDTGESDFSLSGFSGETDSLPDFDLNLEEPPSFNEEFSIDDEETAPAASGGEEEGLSIADLDKTADSFDLDLPDMVELPVEEASSELSDLPDLPDLADFSELSPEEEPEPSGGEAYEDLALDTDSGRDITSSEGLSLSEGDFDLSPESPEGSNGEAETDSDDDEEFTEVPLEDFLGGVSLDMPEVPEETPEGTEKEEASADISTELLKKIADELSSIRNELSILKNDFSLIRGQSPAAEDAVHGRGGFFDQAEDDKIALTGDELNNIISTADFTEEAGADANEESPGGFSLAEGEDLDLIPVGIGADDLSILEDVEAPLEEEAETAGDAVPETANFEDLDLSFGEALEDEPGIEEPEAGKDLLVEDISFEGLEAEEEEALDLSNAVIEEPDLGSKIQENPVEEPPEDISLDLEELDEEEAATPDEAETEALVEEEIDLSTPEEEAEIPAEVPVEPDSSIDQVIPEGFVVESEESPAPFMDDVEEQESFGGAEAGELSPAEEEAEEAAAGEDLLPLDLLEEDLSPVPEAEEAEEARGDAGGSSSGEISGNLRQEIKTVLSYMDKLLEALPEKKIEEFAKSEYFDTYKKLFKELGLV